jgi:CRISPR system Cascade subunit CasC
VKMVSEVFNEGGLERPKTTKADGAEEKDNTKLILFMDRAAIDEMAERFKEHRPALTGKDKEAKAKIVEELGEILATSVKSPDIALFGRMIEIDSKKPFGKLQLGVDAASQVAHAISTNKTSIEFDYFTAVDDLLPAGETGAGMVGTAEFNSACFYRYANIDFNQLERVNLAKNHDGAVNTIEAFIRSSIAAVPTGKQNSMAAQNPPSLILAVARNSGLWSLANAFVKPVRPDGKGDLVENSIAQLGAYWGQLAAMYGDSEIVDKCFVSLDGKDIDGLTSARVGSVDELVARMRAALESPPNGMKGGA